MQKKQVKIVTKEKQVPMQEQPKEDQEVCINSDEELELQAKDQVRQLQLHKFIQNKEQMFDKIKQLSDESVNLIERNLFQESNYFLEQAEEIIEFAANRGKQIDRNLIITVLYNRACSYQGHKQAIETAKKAINVLENIFHQLFLVCQDKQKSVETTQQSIITSQKQNSNQVGTQQQNANQPKSDNKLNTSQKIRENSGKKGNNANNNNRIFDSSYDNEQEDTNNNQNSNPDLENGVLGPKKSIAKEEVVFSQIIQEQAHQFLKTFEQKVIFDTNIREECVNQLNQARQSIYFWKNNPDNNERNMRQELNVPTKNTEDDNRNIVGVQKSQEWIEQFNIGSIMHMTCIQYDDFILFEDILFELSKRQLIEKVNIYNSLIYPIIPTLKYNQVPEKEYITNFQ